MNAYSHNRAQFDNDQIGRYVKGVPLCAQCRTHMFVVRGEPCGSLTDAPIADFLSNLICEVVDGRETNGAIIRIGAWGCIRSRAGVNAMAMTVQ